MKKLIILFILLIFPIYAFCDIELHYIDVGHGDATIILCDDEAMIIDGGMPKTSQLIYSYIYKKLNLKHMNYIIATHPHSDHVGGLPAVLNSVPVDLILSPTKEYDTRAFKSILKYADKQATPIEIPEVGDTLKLGEAEITVVHCWPEAWQTNDMSISLHIQYKNTSFLFTGDAEYMAEYMMIDSGLPLAADVLQVGHHGSSTSSTEEFIQTVNPKYAVISCAQNDQYGHPCQETLNTLKAIGSSLFRTNLHGTIIIHSDGTNIDVKVLKNYNGNVFEK